MHPLLQHDKTHLPEILDQTQTIALEFLQSLPERTLSASRQLQHIHYGDDQLLPEGIGAKTALDDFWRHYADGITGSAGPRYFGFVTGGSTPAALAADWLVSTFDQVAQLSHDNITAELELATLSQLKTLLGLPAAMTGSFVSGATMANMVGVLLARQWLGHQRGVDVAQQGLAALGDIRVFSASPHSSSVKALSMSGIGRNALTLIPTLQGSEAIDPAALEMALQETGEAPVLVLASGGTVNTVAFDDMNALVALRQRYGFWLHVDAAFGGVAACSAQFSPLLSGWEQADSITVDAHKWLNVPYDSAIQFTRHLSLQREIFQNQSAYLDAATLLENDYLHLTPENSRRWRALPLWMALRAYGQQGMQEVVERNVALARQLGERLQNSAGFELLAPVHLNVVCFALSEGDAAARDAFLQRLDSAGVVRCTPTALAGRPGIRGALVNWQTQQQDIDRALVSLLACL